GDGKPDLAVANDASASVSVLLNQTTPGATAFNFAPHQDFATGNDPTSVALGDFNGDGRLDLAVTNVYSTMVSVLMNETVAVGDVPRFAPQQLLTVGQGPYSVAVGDLNGDGRPDLAVTNRNAVSAYSVSVLLNTLPPVAVAVSFAPRQDFATSR